MLPKLLKCDNRECKEYAIWSVEALRKRLIWDRHGTPQAQLKYTDIIVDQAHKWLKFDMKEPKPGHRATIFDILCDENARKAQISWADSKHAEALAEVLEARKYLQPDDHLRTLHLDALEATFRGFFKQYPRQTECILDGLKLIEKYQIKNDDALSIFQQQAVILASNKNAPAAIKLIETRWRPLYMKMMEQKNPNTSQAGLDAEDAMLKVWKTW